MEFFFSALNGIKSTEITTKPRNPEAELQTNVPSTTQ